MSILISAANADVCQSMARILRMEPSYKGVPLIGLAPDGEWPSKAYFDDVLPVPMVSDKSYFDVLSSHILKIKPDVFIPFSEAELGYFSDNPDKISELATKVIINSPKHLKIFLDKAATNDFLRENGLPALRTFSLTDVKPDDLPVIVKPRKSAGSKNMAIIRYPKMLEGVTDTHQQDGTLDSYIAQEWIDEPDEEYTCAVWRFAGEKRTCIMRRKLQGGMTGQAVIENRAEIEDVLEQFLNALEGDVFLNVQLRMNADVPYIFEVNPRFSSTLMMRHKVGFKDFIWTLDYYSKKVIPAEYVPTAGVTMYRVSEEIVRGE